METLIESLPTWLRFVVGGGAVASAIVAAEKAFGVIQRFKQWLGEAAREALLQDIVQHSPNGEIKALKGTVGAVAAAQYQQGVTLDRVEGTLDGHITEADKIWAALRTNMTDRN